MFNTRNCSISLSIIGAPLWWVQNLLETLLKALFTHHAILAHIIYFDTNHKTPVLSGVVSCQSYFSILHVLCSVNCLLILYFFQFSQEVLRKVCILPLPLFCCTPFFLCLLFCSTTHPFCSMFGFYSDCLVLISHPLSSCKHHPLGSLYLFNFFIFVLIDLCYVFSLRM